MTKRLCPLGEDCDLTIAWMAGRQSAKDAHEAEIDALEAELGKAIHIIRILVSTECDDGLGEAFDLASAYLAEL
jgi:hypothetical protein